jgi:hypothetical protein
MPRRAPIHRELWLLRTAALLAVLVALTPDVTPSGGRGFAPITCETDADLGPPLRSFNGTVPPDRAVIVVGAEGSGSKLAALAAAQALEGAAFRSPGFPPTYDPSCADSRGVWKKWNGHGVHANYCAGSVVVHRSMPHGACFPDVRSLVSRLAGAGFAVQVVVAARDPALTLRTKARHHQRSAAVAAREQGVAFQLLRGLAADPPCPLFVWSYEAFLELREAYSGLLLDFLHLPRPARDEHEPKLLPTYDGNRAYARRRRPWEWVRGAALALFAPRAPAYVAGARPELR